MSTFGQMALVTNHSGSGIRVDHAQTTVKCFNEDMFPTHCVCLRKTIEHMSDYFSTDTVVWTGKLTTLGSMPSKDRVNSTIASAAGYVSYSMNFFSSKIFLSKY